MSSADPIPRDPERQLSKREALYRQLGFWHPDALEALVQGNAFFKAEDYEASVARYNLALQIEPEFHAARFERARAARRLGRHKDAIDDYQKLSNQGVGGDAISLILVEALVLNDQAREADAVLSLISDSRLGEEDRVFYIIYKAACRARIDGFFDFIKTDFPRVVRSLRSKPVRPTWYTFTTLRKFLAAGGLTEDFRQWFANEVEPVLDDKD